MLDCVLQEALRSIRVRFRTALQLPGVTTPVRSDRRPKVLHRSKKSAKKFRTGLIENPGLLQHVVGTVLGDRAESLAGKLHADVTTATTVELGHPDALLLKVGIDRTVDSLGDVATDTALLLGKTGTMNAAALVRHGKCDIADTGHKMF